MKVADWYNFRMQSEDTIHMSPSAEVLLRQVIQLPTSDRAVLIDGLISSLDTPDSSLDALWLKEAESRLAAYRSGELGAVGADQVFTALGTKFDR